MNNYDYGIIGNGRSAALVSKYGSIDWCCLPDFDSPSVFAALLDREKGGSCSIKLSDSYNVSQHYLYKTNILVTCFDDGANKFEMIDFMPRYKTDEDQYYTPPEIYRFIRVKQGQPRVAFCYNPRLNYAQGNTIHDINGEYLRRSSQSPFLESIYLYSSIDLKKIVQCEEVELKGDNFLLISYHQKAIPIDIDRVYIEYQRTKVYWLNWVNRSKVFREYNQNIQRSLLVLKLLSYQKTGALIAAVTTSLPEIVGRERNWDYRYCWLRDASMTIETLIKCGHFNAARRFMNFITNVIRSKEEGFQIMYGIRFERNLEEKVLDHLSGYQNSKPVRIGNDAFRQVQHDIYGFLMDILYLYFHYFSGTLDEVEEMWSITKNIVRHVSFAWNQPDSGIWEFRGIKKHFVFSKVLSWVAVERAIKISNILNQNDKVNEWKELAETIYADVIKNGWNERKNSFVQSYDSDEIDASLLLMDYYGFIESIDPRYIGTVNAVRKELYHNGLVYRYRHQDDFGIPESAFVTCTFWFVRSLFAIGEKEEAKRVLDQLLSCANYLGLFGEDIDFKTRRLLGNFPQAYSHVALIQAATLFSEQKHRLGFIRP